MATSRIKTSSILQGFPKSRSLLAGNAAYNPVPPAKATGGTIVYSAPYYYHTFTGNGTFAPTESLTADILVIAGGGGGRAGGGGAGGLLAHTSQSLTVQNYSITIGAGGGDSVNGTNSQFGSLTASVGGGASSPWGETGDAGGSGGGGGSVTGTTINGGAGTAGQGNNGGSGVNERAGGGGGAGAAGANGATIGGAGGNGLSTYSSWGLATSTGQNISGTYWYAGGAGGGAINTGGAGGNGGGGAGSYASPVSGTANTGGGGGGAYASLGASGGSGITIVRYAV